MALTYNSIQAIAQDYIAPKVYDSTFKKTPLAWYLREQKRLSLRGGLNISVPIIKSQFNYDWYTGADPSTLEALDPMTRAVWSWKWLRVPFVITEEDIDKTSAENVADLVDVSEQVASLTMAYALDAALCGTNSSDSDQLDGLQNMFAASGTEYAGITDTDMTSPAAWLCDLYTPITAGTLTALDMKLMQSDVAPLGGNPDLGLCNYATLAKIWALAQTAQRFGMESTAKLGFPHVMFEDMPIMADVNASGSGRGTADNWLMFLNTAYLKLVIHQNKAFSTRVYAPIPQQEVYIGKVFLGCNLITTMRRAHSVFKTVNPSS